MLRVEPGPNRWKLGFREVVLSNFGFLAGYGFRPVREDVTLVRYESGRAFINIYHGRLSNEIGIEVGRLDRAEKYGLGYLVSWAGREAWKSEGFGRHTMFQVSTPDGVRRFVPKVADLVRKYGEPFLRAEPDFYAALDAENARWAGSYEQRQRVEDARRAGEAARMAKDYAAMVQAYASIEPELTALERERLAYARTKEKRAD